VSVHLSAWNNSAPTGWVLMKFNIWVAFYNLLRKFKLNKNLIRATGILHDDLWTFTIISCWILLRMRNVSHKSCRENQNTHFMFNIFFSEKCVIYEIMCKYKVQPHRPLLIT
jgi:hypothetical protein